ncbi:23S rRNA/tRNA pseudouridine synthase A [Corynebacterium hansenii]|nr:23S rRNA/tRNA pseudouridine synthase A [Corynebacterium hansenii]
MTLDDPGCFDDPADDADLGEQPDPAEKPEPTSRRSPRRRRRRTAPLPIRDGLNPSRVRAPQAGPGASGTVTALELLTAAIEGQTHRHPADDAAAIAARFADGLVVDAAGRPLSPGSELRPGADIWFYRLPAPEPRLAGPMPIIHRDRDIVVVDKPPFLATTPRGRHIVESAVVRLRRELGDGDLIPAHRLDRLTSGVLVFVARPEARGAYQDLFAEPGAVVKRYEALTRLPGPADLPAPPFTLATRQEKTRGVLQARTVAGEPNARTIVDGIEVGGHVLGGAGSDGIGLGGAGSDGTGLDDARRLPGTALWHLRPLTGRTHQLRLHLHELGFPILGDPLYPEVLPADAEDPARPMHLVCRELAFDDPFTGERRVFRSGRSTADPATAP